MSDVDHPERPPINAVAFDLGGVLGPSPGQALAPLAQRLGLSLAELFDCLAGSTWLTQAEIGAIDRTDYAELACRELRARHGVNLDPATLDDLLAGLLVLQPDALAVVDEVHQRHVTALVTNNFRDSAHTWNAQLPPGLFDHVLDSSQLGVRKPDPPIYQELLRRLDLAAESVLFIDDLPANIAGAAALGLQTMLITAQTSLRDELTTLGVIG